MYSEKKNFDLVIQEREKFISSFLLVIKILKNAKQDAQAEFIQKLIDFIKQDNLEMFIKLINGVDMWGGSGAVWEVYIENVDEEKKFEQEIINIIDLMEKTKILGKGIIPIRKLFSKK
jgi:hypothetical protein